MFPTPENTPPAIYGEREAGRSQKVREALELLSKNVATSRLDQGELLAEVKSNHYYVGYGFESFAQFVAESLDMKERQALYLISIATKAKDLKIDRSSLEPIGISKLKEIFSLEPDSFFFNAATNQNEKLDTHMKRLLELAPTVSLDAIRAEVKRLKGIQGDDEYTWLNIHIKRADKEEVEKAFELFRRNNGDLAKDKDGDPIELSDGYVLRGIAVDYLSDPNNHSELMEE
jgi:hypothetical protein